MDLDNLKTTIDNYYSNKKEELQTLFNNNEKMIDGRICHSSIILLNILANTIDINNYMEIGVHNGGSMTMLLSGNNKNINIYGIDLFEDMYDETKHLNKEKFTTYQYFKRDNLSMTKTRNNLDKVKKHYNNNSNIHLLQGNSYFDETETNFKEELNSHELDLLFIDGDHTLDGVKNDYVRYSKYVKKGGYIIFDDYHHPIIKEYCDKLLKENSSIKLITKFKSFKTDAIDLLVQKV
jgi:predicted O-methyltransferase YrrM